MKAWRNKSKRLHEGAEKNSSTPETAGFSRVEIQVIVQTLKRNS
jgi:hypothetical protein